MVLLARCRCVHPWLPRQADHLPHLPPPTAIAFVDTTVLAPPLPEVISPDPNLRVDEVCVPQLMALVLTYPDRVTEHNIEKLKQRVLNGGWVAPSVYHPRGGAASRAASMCKLRACGAPATRAHLEPVLRPPALRPHPPTPAGTSQWPGANFILFPSGDKVYLKFGDRRRIASELKIGDVVERHLDREL